MKKVFIVLLNVLIFIGIFCSICFASEATVSMPTAINIGESFSVVVNIPADAVAYQGEIKVNFSDGTSKTSGVLANVTGINGDYSHPGNMSATFNAPLNDGVATVTVVNLKITDRIGNKINSAETLSGTISINKPAEAVPVPTTPEPTPTLTPTPEPAPTTTSDEPNWNNTGDTVYALEKLNVRSGWGISYSLIGSLSKGSSVTRIAVGSNGWDKINYNGTTAYVMSKYLTTTNPEKPAQETPATPAVEEPGWTETGDKVYAIQSLNVRSGWATSYEIIGGLAIGQSITRIAVGSNGWDKINYNGTTAYVTSKFLSTEKPKLEENTVTVDENILSESASTATSKNNVKNETIQDNSIVDNTVQSDNSIPEETIDEYNKLVQEVGVLPAVGRNFADYIYIISVCIIVLIVGFVGLKIRSENEE